MITTFYKIKKIEILFQESNKGTPTPNQTSSQQKMSFNNRSNNARSNNNRPSTDRRPHCVHCQQTGEPESVYSTHFVKSLPDRTGKRTTTCPKILATECNYCYGLGHTRGHCPILKERRLAYEREERKQQVEQQKQEQLNTKSKQVTAGRYSALYESDNEEDVPVKEDFPAMAAPSQMVTSDTRYATAAATEVKAVTEVKPETEVENSNGFQVLKSWTGARPAYQPETYYGSTFERSLPTDAHMITTWASKSQAEDDDFW